MIHTNLPDMELRYYDTIGEDQDPENRAYHESCHSIQRTLSAALNHKALPVPEGNFSWRRVRVREHCNLLIYETDVQLLDLPA